MTRGLVWGGPGSRASPAAQPRSCSPVCRPPASRARSVEGWETCPVTPEAQPSKGPGPGGRRWVQSWGHRETPRITGLESGCMLSPAPACPFSLPEPALPLPGPLPRATAWPPGTEGPQELWPSSGTLREREGARAALPAPAAQRQTSHIDPLPTARQTSCPSSAGCMGCRGWPQQLSGVEAARPDGEEHRSRTGLDQAWLCHLPAAALGQVPWAPLSLHCPACKTESPTPERLRE